MTCRREALRAIAENIHVIDSVEAFEAAAGGPALVDGKLIELPVARAARRILERAKGRD